MNKRNIIKNADKIAEVMCWEDWELEDDGDYVRIGNISAAPYLIFRFHFDVIEIFTIGWEHQALTVTQYKEIFKLI